MKYKSKHFSEVLYPKIICPVIKKDFASIDVDFQENVGVSACFLMPKFESVLSRAYEEKRDWLRRNYFPKSERDDENTDNINTDKNKDLLDMHKIAAVVARCLLLHKPISFNIDEADIYIKRHKKDKDKLWLLNNYLINYKIAVDVALRITLYDLIDKLDSANKKGQSKLNNIHHTLIKLSEIDNKLYLADDVLVPITHEPFYNSLVINLAINDVNKRDFDYLGFATICFQLQQYNVLKFEFDQFSHQ